jgi:hypothetical protein
MMLAEVACGTGSNVSDGDVIRSDFPLALSPIYTAFDGRHDFVVPIAAKPGVSVDDWEIVDGQGARVDDAVELSSLSASSSVELKTRRPGDFFVLAHAGNKTGCAELHISAGEPDAWSEGKGRYENAIDLGSWSPDRAEPQALPTDLSCTQCHGAGTTARVKEPTVQWTAGYSDEQLTRMLTVAAAPPTAAAPNASKCPSHVPMMIAGDDSEDYRRGHTWQASPGEAAGLVLFLRSLAPDPLTPPEF